MGSEKSNHQYTSLILHQGNQAVIVGFDIEHDPTAFENARFGVRSLYVLRGLPIGCFHYRPPCVELRARSLDALMSCPCDILLRSSIKWNDKFHFMEDASRRHCRLPYFCIEGFTYYIPIAQFRKKAGAIREEFCSAVSKYVV
jgi:hypothetical protein